MARKAAAAAPARARRRSTGPPGEAPPVEGGGEKPPAKGGRKRRRRSPLLSFLVKLAIVSAVLAAVFSFVLGVHIHHGNRMYPFIMDGDLVITYKLEPYRVGDAVVYRRPDGSASVSRIAALGVHEIELTESGQLLVNGAIPNEQVFYPTRALEGSSLSFPYAMGDGQVFLLDDYRTIGEDSRAFGALDESALRGKVVYVFRRRGI